MPHFVQCDVEGAEFAVFECPKDTDQAPPVILLNESWAAKSFVNVWRFFEFLGSLVNAQYRFFEIGKAGLTELRSTELDYANVLAVPEHRYSDIEVLA